MFNYIINGSITNVKGIKAAGIHCGIKKKKKDIALIVSDYPATVTGTFTLNKVKAAPLLVSEKVIEKNKKVRAVLINSGNANACTGEKGLEDALEIQSYCAEKLGFNSGEILVSSTGVIGEYLNVPVYKKGINEIVTKLSDENGIDAAEALMTTDLHKKHFAVKINLPKGEVIIGGICKGSGMIMPNMATMLAFLATDAEIESSFLKEILSESVNKSFNRISVDGETSTNDMVTLMANGASKIKIEKDTEDSGIFKNALLDLTIKMAKEIVADGEGATKLITINVLNAESESDANKVAKSLAMSPLVKTAIYGNDANWGRIISAAGNSGANFDPKNISISFDDLLVLAPNYEILLDEEAALKKLNKKEIEINIDLSAGDKSSTWWTCDYSENYIKINSAYRS